MERTCFAFNENKHNQCECLALKNLECKKKDCKFYKHKGEINIRNIEKEIKEYAKTKK